jgi:hypothetical protein
MKKEKKYPSPSGTPWKPSQEDPATVPVALPVILKKIEGPYNERDRKLWVFLLHAVWNEIPDEDTGKAVIHELPVAKINQVFRDLGADHNNKWIWESVRRLARTVAEWEDNVDDGVEALLGSAITKAGREDGRLRFYFPPILAPKLKRALQYARLRTHFLIKLSGKYSVTLYELLETAANRRYPVLEYTLVDLRRILKIPEGKLKRYQDIRRRTLEPAIEQINRNPLEAGFTVEMEPVKKGRAIKRVRFTVYKVNERKLAEAALKQGRSPTTALVVCESKAPLFDEFILLETATYERAKKIAPHWDIYDLEKQWRDKIAREGKPVNPNKAFLGYCRKVVMRQKKKL